MTAERRCAIAVMAKAPRAGLVKTRLVPPLSAEQAMALSAAFLADVTANIAAAGGNLAIDGFVAFAPAGSEALFEEIVAPGTGLVLADGGVPMPPGVEGFGRCLLHAALTLFGQGFASVCLLNADSPNLPTAALTRAAEALAAPGDRVVLGGAADGGYYLLGMKRPHARLFQAVEWSTSRVAADTRGRAADLGLEVVGLPSWYDVDDAGSLSRLLNDLDDPDSAGTDAPTPFAAPATRRCLARLGLGRRAADGKARPRPAHPMTPTMPLDPRR